MPKIIGDNIDTLCNVELRPITNNRLRDAAREHYEEIRAAQKEPGSFLAAELLQNNVHRGDTVLIITGCSQKDDLPFGETDGPLGAAALARTLYLAFEAKCVVCTPENCMTPVKNTLKAAGCYVRDQKYLNMVPGACVIESICCSAYEKCRAYMQLLEKYHPSIIILCGVAEHDQKTGEVCSPTGVIVDEETAVDVQTLLGLCRTEEIPVIIAGGACNEDVAVKVPSTVSNWGAYGICAMLAFMQNNPDLIQDEQTELRMLKACAMGRSADGYLLRPERSVAGVAEESEKAVLTLLRQIVTNGMRTVVRISS